jgi:hypothetical protein
MDKPIYIIETRRSSEFSLTAIHADAAQAMAHAVELTVKATQRYGEPSENHTDISHTWMWPRHAVRMYEHWVGEATART